MRKYEITAVYSPNAVEETKNGFKETLAKHSVTVTNEEDWGIKKLWHPVDGKENGHYNFFQCEAEPNVIEKIESEAKINQNILKAMVVRVNG